MKGQLAAWIKRVEEVWAAPPLPAPSRKTFQAKNALPRLRSYREDPVPGFWEKFPVNKEAAGWSLIKGDKNGYWRSGLGIGERNWTSC